MFTKTCSICNEEKTLDLFIINKRKTDGRGKWCKECAYRRQREEYQREILEQGGLVRIAPKPNVYHGEEQKRQVFQLMNLLGWKFNEEKGIWWKEGIKTEDGVFPNILKTSKKYIRPKKKYEEYEIIYKGEWIKAHQIIPRWVEMYEKGLTYNFISRTEGLSPFIIKKYVTLYYATH